MNRNRKWRQRHGEGGGGFQEGVAPGKSEKTTLLESMGTREKKRLSRERGDVKKK